jgi:uncharacterized membrane protein (DUF485 family)
MADFSTPPPAPAPPVDPATEQRNRRIGQILFVLYTVAYAGFIIANAFFPKSMEQTPVAGINLAILYGLGLILLAWVVSLIYGWLCRRPVPGSRLESNS